MTTPTAAPLSAEQLDELAQRAGFIINPVGQIVVPAPYCDARGYLTNFFDLIAQARAAEKEDPCVICGADEPRTGTCGSDDARALCNRSTPQATAPQPSVGEQADEKCRYCAGAGEHHQERGVYVECNACEGTGKAHAAVAQGASSAPAEYIADVILKLMGELHLEWSSHEGTGDDEVDALSNKEERSKLIHLVQTYFPSAQRASSAPAGYKLVPIEPTPEQQQAGHDTPGAHMYNASYRAMVAAASPTATPASASIGDDPKFRDLLHTVQALFIGDDSDARAALVRYIDSRAPSPSREEAPAAQAVEAEAELRQRLGEALTEKLHEMQGNYEDEEGGMIDWCDSRIMDELLDAVIPSIATPAASVAQAEDAGTLPRIPTEVMLNAARDWSVKKYGIGVGNDAAIGCWQAMHDAAMSSTQHSAKAGGAA